MGRKKKTAVQQVSINFRLSETERAAIRQYVEDHGLVQEDFLRRTIMEKIDAEREKKDD